VFTFGLWMAGLRRLRAVTICVAIVSWMAMVWFATHGNQNHAYLGTEARAFGPLSGAVLAFLYPPRRRRPAKAGARAGAMLDLAALCALLGLAALFVTARQTSTWLYLVGFVLTDLCTAVLIVVIVHPMATFGRAIGTPILRWIGLRSYGIYLWGIAVFEFTRPGLDLHTSPLVTLALRVVLVMAVVEVSYRYIETPVRSGAFQTAWNNLRAATGERRRVLQRRWQFAAAAVVVATASLGFSAVASQPPDALQLVGGHTAVGGGDCVLTRACRIPPAPTAATTTTQAGATTTQAGATTSSTRPTPTTRPLVNSGGWKVSAVGDSVLLGAASAVETTLTGPLGGGVLVNAAVSRHAGTCIQVLQAFAALKVLAPLVIVHCGNNGALGPGFVDQVMQIAGPNRNVVFASLKVPRSWEYPDNLAVKSDVVKYRNARMYDWHSLGTLLTPQNVYFYKDGYHLTPAGRDYYARNLLDALKSWHWV
jgi:hypothetical protein